MSTEADLAEMPSTRTLPLATPPAAKLTLARINASPTPECFSMQDALRATRAFSANDKQLLLQGPAFRSELQRARNVSSL